MLRLFLKMKPMYYLPGIENHGSSLSHGGEPLTSCLMPISLTKRYLPIRKITIAMVHPPNKNSGLSENSHIACTAIGIRRLGKS
jgi:hypothetical protein